MLNNNSKNNSNYTAERTSINTNDITVAGINVNILTWIIITATVIGIITLLYSYFMQNNRNRNHSDYYNE